MVLERTEFTSKTANQKDLMRLISAGTKMFLERSLVIEGQNKILIDGLCNQTTSLFVKHYSEAPTKTKYSSAGYCSGKDTQDDITGYREGNDKTKTEKYTDLRLSKEWGSLKLHRRSLLFKRQP